MKNALVISGGGSKGAFAVGAIERLREAGITWDIVVGCSTGALIAPLVVTDMPQSLTGTSATRFGRYAHGVNATIKLHIT